MKLICRDKDGDRDRDKFIIYNFKIIFYMTSYEDKIYMKTATLDEIEFFHLKSY